MGFHYEDLAPTAPTPPVLDPRLEPTRDALGFVQTNSPLLPLGRDPWLRAHIALRECRADVILAGRTAAWVWGAGKPQRHEAYVRSAPPWVRADLLPREHVRACDVIRIGAVRVIAPERTALDLLCTHGLEALPMIVAMKPLPTRARLVRRMAAAGLPAPVRREAAEVIAAYDRLRRRPPGRTREAS
ncbi:MAG: hypothetical protein Q4P36_07535 [Bowdeniella nasicola]|nr:hypothetical protein [Bowdeniella nasicola]